MGEMRTALFDFHGLSVRLEAAASLTRLFDACEQLWAYYQSPNGHPPHLTICLQETKEWAPLQALQRDDSPIVFGPLGWYYEGECFILHQPNLVLVGLPGHIDCYIRHGCAPDARDFAHFALNLAFIESLRHHGLFYVHSAALESPTGKRTLIAGDAGQGKSTLTTSLLMSGYRYLSDDAVFIDVRAQQSRILGYHKNFHVGNDLLHRFDSTAGAPAFSPYGTTGKSEIDPEKLFPGQRMRSLDGIDVILIPSIHSQTRTVIEALPQADVLTQFFTASAQVFFDKRLAARHLKALRNIAGHARGYRFQAGQDVYDNPMLYDQLVRDL
jgi:hypothetical protein